MMRIEELRKRSPPKILNSIKINKMLFNLISDKSTISNRDSEAKKRSKTDRKETSLLQIRISNSPK